MIPETIPLQDKDDWETPQPLFDKLNAEFGFTLDACANDTNHKCDRYFTKEQDSFKYNWDGVVWVNPPYGRSLESWMAKAYVSACNGATVVCLVPARTETEWFQYCWMATEIRFIKGRVKFVGAKYNAPFPSAIVVFNFENGRPKTPVCYPVEQ